MIPYRGYSIPSTTDEIKSSTYHEHWQGDWLVIKGPNDPSDRLNLLYERGSINKPDVESVVHRCKQSVDRYLQSSLLMK